MMLLSANQIPICSIITQTRTGNDILNQQSFDLCSADVYGAHLFDEKYKNSPATIFRTKSIPLYNCHGLTFGSRRTTIWDNDEVNKILSDDKYREIDKNNVLPGDTIIYIDDNGDIEHSGIVIESPIKNLLQIPLVLSKWGRYREVIHSGNNCPYNFSHVKYFRIIE